jgi:GAF domain-containing protein
VPTDKHIAGSPLESLTWRREVPNHERRVAIKFRDGTPYDDRLDFLRDLSQAANRLRMDLLKNPLPDYVPKEIDWDAIAKLPKPSMSGDELMALTRGDDHDENEEPIRHHLLSPIEIDGKMVGEGWLLITEEEYTSLRGLEPQK